MIDPSKVCLFIPNGLKGFKQNLFNRIGGNIGRVIRGDFAELAALPDDMIPAVGCTPELRPLIDGWQGRGRKFLYWDRGYCRRVFATWLPRAASLETSFYRWHVNNFQMTEVRKAKPDRWLALKTPLEPWRKGGRNIIIAQPTPTYAKFHKIPGWRDKTIAVLEHLTTRPIIVRDKEDKRSLQEDLASAHCLVAHGSNAAVEAAILGCPVCVDQSSAAALVGQTDLSKIETPIFPDREPWAWALATSQWNESELVDGTLWRQIE